MVTYQRLTDKELDTFIQMRIRQLREEGATEDIDLVPHLKDYYNRHMEDGTFVSWLATIKLSLPAGCRLWRNRLTLGAQVGNWEFFQVCLPIRIIAAEGLQRNYSQG